MNCLDLLRPALCMCVFVCSTLKGKILPPSLQLILLWKYLVLVLKVFKRAFCPRWPGRSVVWCPLCSFSQLSSVFLTHAPTHTHTHAEHFSVMCLAECKISSLQLEGNRFDKIPFSAREAFKAQNGMAKHGTARLVSPRTRLYLHGPAALYWVNSLALPRPFSDCTMTPNEHRQGLFPLCFSSRLNKSTQARSEDTGASDESYIWGLVKLPHMNSQESVMWQQL